MLTQSVLRIKGAANPGNLGHGVSCTSRELQTFEISSIIVPLALFQLDNSNLLGGCFAPPKATQFERSVRLSWNGAGSGRPFFRSGEARVPLSTIRGEVSWRGCPRCMN